MEAWRHGGMEAWRHGKHKGAKIVLKGQMKIALDEVRGCQGVISFEVPSGNE
jgi:hypothetical protein